MADSPSRTPLWTRLAIVVVVLGSLLAPVTPLRVVSVVFLVGVLPGFPLARRVPNISPVATLGIATAMSPFLFGLVAFVCMHLGSTPLVGGVIAAIVFGGLYLFAGGASPAISDTERRVFYSLLAMVVIAAALTLILPTTNSFWRYREDSWFHAAVLNHISNQGVPPNDPYFSPLPLQYMYFYHVLLGGVSGLTGLGAFGSMITLNLIALIGFVFGFYFLTGHVSNRPLSRLLGTGLAVFGMNGLFYLFYPLRLAQASVGDTSGGEVLAAFFPWSPAGHNTAVALLSVEGNQALLLNKFMLGTAFTLTFGLLAVALAALIATKTLLGATRERSPGDPTMMLYVLALTGIAHLHMVMGAVVIVASLGTAVLFWQRSETRAYLPLVLLSVLPVVIALPYVLQVMPRGGASSISFSIQPGHMLGLMADVLPVLLPASLLLWRRWRVPEREPAVVTLTVWCAIVLLIALLVNLPTNNETKFAFPLYIALAAVAVVSIDAWLSRGRPLWLAASYLLAVTLPVNAVYFYHAFRDESSIEFTEAEQAAYRWIAENTPAKALFLDEGDLVRVPVLAGRDQLWGGSRYAELWGYDKHEIDGRRRVHDAIYAEDTLDSATVAPLFKLNRPLYVILRETDTEHGVLYEWRRQNPMFRGKFIAEEIVIFEIERFAKTADP